MTQYLAKHLYLGTKTSLPGGMDIHWLFEKLLLLALLAN